jgi:ribonuclease HI
MRQGALMSESALLTINIDGAARGNPGPAAFAYSIVFDGKVIEGSGCLGNTTNNVAEYTALVRALERAAEIKGRKVAIRSDSELLVKQMTGVYQVKNAQLRELHGEAKKLCRTFDLVNFSHVRRAENSRADFLCNEALDGRPASGSPSASKAPMTPVAAKSERSAGTKFGADQVRDDVLMCLRGAARMWSLGDPEVPSPDLVWDQIWSILEEANILKRAKAK